MQEILRESVEGEIDAADAPVNHEDSGLAVSAEAADAAIAAIVFVVVSVLALVTARETFASLVLLKMMIDPFQYELNRDLTASGLLNLVAIAGVISWAIRSGKNRQSGESVQASP